MKIKIDKINWSNYVAFFNYYEKQWLNYEQSWNDINIKFNFTRTNNPCETFHRRLNAFVEIKNPRLSYLAHCFFEITKKYYLSYNLNVTLL